MRRRGFSLAEGLLALGIVFLVLGIASQLMRQYASILRSSESRSNTLTALQVALQQMIDDVRQSQVTSSPPAGNTALELIFLKVDPVAAWLPSPIPNPAGTWNPMDPVHMVTVRYFLDQGEVKRTLTPLSGAPAETWAIAQGVSGMQCSNLGDGIQIQLTLQETHRTMVLTGWSSRVKF